MRCPTSTPDLQTHEGHQVVVQNLQKMAPNMGDLHAFFFLIWLFVSGLFSKGVGGLSIGDESSVGFLII